MKELGAVLHQARKQKGLTIEDVEKETRIRAQFLIAIEEGELHEIPGELCSHLYGRMRSGGFGSDEMMVQYEMREAWFTEQAQSRNGEQRTRRKN